MPIDLREPMNDYETRVLDFYKWVDERICSEHAGLAEVKALRIPMATMRGGVAKPPGT